MFLVLSLIAEVDDVAMIFINHKMPGNLNDKTVFFLAYLTNKLHVQFVAQLKNKCPDWPDGNYDTPTKTDMRFPKR